MGSLAATKTLIRGFDNRVDAAFDVLRGRPVADRVFYTASALGDFSLIWILLGGLRGLRSERDWHAAVRLATAVGAESIFVNGMVKTVFRRSRPQWDGPRPLRVRQPRTSSFPSGHATSSASSAVLLAEGDALWPLYYAVAAVVASSRVYVRIHHASDVVAGLALGTGLGLLGRRLKPLPPAPTITGEPAGPADG